MDVTVVLLNEEIKWNPVKCLNVVGQNPSVCVHVTLDVNTTNTFVQ